MSEKKIMEFTHEAVVAQEAIEPTNPEVIAKPQKRRFSAKYKRDILRKAELCTKRGELGSLLRREGLYSSQLITWRKKSEQGELTGLDAKKRGPKSRAKDD